MMVFFLLLALLPGESVAFLCFEQPGYPTIPIPGKFQQEFFLVITVGDVPDVAK